MNLLKNINELAFNEIVQYVKNLRTSGTFRRITEKYIKIHNKGLFVDFTFNSDDAEGLFSHFSYFYGFKLNKNINKKFNREKVLQLSSLEEKVENKLNRLSNEMKNLNKVQQNLNTNAKSLTVFQEQGFSTLETENIGGYISMAINRGDILSFSNAVFTERKNNIKEKMDVTKSLIKTVNNAQKNIRYIENETNNVEVEFFKLTMKKFFLIFTQYVSEFFVNKKIAIIYNEKEWIRLFKEFKRSNHNYFGKIDGLSNFDNLMLEFIQRNESNFYVEIFDKKFIYSLSKDDLRTRLNHCYDKKKSKEKLAELYERFNDFVKINNNFVLNLNLISDIAKTFGESDPLFHYTLCFFKNHFTAETYNEFVLLTNMINKEESDNKFSNQEHIELPSIIDLFPNIEFKIEKVKDMTYWFALKQEKYNDVVTSISNGEYILSMFNTPKK